MEIQANTTAEAVGQASADSSATSTTEVSLSLVLVCIAAVMTVCGVLLATSASLIGDGSYYLLRAIQTGQPFQLAGRQGINLIREGPLLLARFGGIRNTRLLTLFEGIGFIVFPAFVWSLALVVARHSRARFTLVALSCGLSFSSVILFSVSEVTLAVPLVVLASLLLTQPTPWSGARATLVVLATGLLFFSHESVFICAVLLAAMGLYRIRAHLGPVDTMVSLIVTALSVAVFCGALWTLVVWPNKNSGDFLDLSTSIALLGMGSFLLIGWCLLYERVPGAEWLRWLLLALATALTGLGIHAGVQAGAEGAYQSRSASVVAAVVIQVLLFIDWIRIRRSDDRIPDLGRSRGAVRAATAFLVAVMLIPVAGAARWSTVVDAFQSAVTQHSGDLPLTDVRTSRATSYLIPWTDTSLSLLLRSNDADAVIENTGSFNPFPIGTAERQIPAGYRWGG